MSYDRNILHIIYASDDKFAEIMGISLISLFYHNTDAEDIVVYIMNDGISGKKQEAIESIFSKFKRGTPIWIAAKKICRELSMQVTLDRGSQSQYARLFLSDALPKDLCRVLYLDCDTIINQSLKKIWNMDLMGKTIGALMDAFSKYYRQNIGLKADDVMFNSGVMLIDLTQWREKKIEEQILDFIVSMKGKIPQGDQGALNAILSHDTYCFEPCYNSVTIFFDFSYEDMLIYRKPPKFYSKEQVRDAVENPVIIHFTTSFLSKRPWIKGCKHKYVSIWLWFKENSPWKEKDLWEDIRPLWKKIMVAIYKRLPIRIANRLAGCVQVYVRPFIAKISIRR